MERCEKERWLLTSVTKTPNGSFHFSPFSRYPSLCLARCAATFARLPQALMLHQRRR